MRIELIGEKYRFDDRFVKAPEGLCAERAFNRWGKRSCNEIFYLMLGDLPVLKYDAGPVSVDATINMEKECNDYLERKSNRFNKKISDAMSNPSFIEKITPSHLWENLDSSEFSGLFLSDLEYRIEKCSHILPQVKVSAIRESDGHFFSYASAVALSTLSDKTLLSEIISDSIININGMQRNSFYPFNK